MNSTFEMTEKPISERESLDLIQQMIRSTRGNFSHDSFYYLFWGWLVFVTAIANYILLRMDVSWANAVWMLMPLGAIVSIVYSKRQSARATVRTHLDRVLGYLWLGFGISMILTLIFMGKLGLGTYPVLITLYGIGLFVSGGAIQFRPLVIGGICCWLIAAFTYFQSFDIQLLCLAAALVAGYIIPGHLLRAHNKNEAI